MTGQQLKNSILQLAIQGKLVPQDPNDEPASELLKRIRKEKEQLVKDGKLKKKDLESEPITDEEKPFDIPESWEWCRLGELLIGSGAGKSPDCEKKPRKGEEWGVITTTAIQDGYFDKEENKVLPSKFLIQEEQIVHNGDFLITRAGPRNRTGIMCVVKEEPYHLILSDKTVRLEYCKGKVEPDYLLCYLRSSEGRTEVEKYMVGMAASQVNISQNNMKMFILPLPPLSEQQRIVAKIEELMPFVEEYGKSQEALNKLNAELPEQLKKSILQQAIMGKLGTQVPTDEPASVLLSKIRAEKEQLVKAGKLKKKDLETTPIDDDEKPFDIPDSWEWVRLGEIIGLLSGQDLTPDRYSDTEQGMPYITGASHFVNGQLVLSRWTSSPTAISHKGDLLITCKGTVGTMAYNSVGDIHIARQVMAISSNGGYLPYIKFYLEKNVSELEKQAHSIIPGISRDVLLEAVIPLPPLAEQHRIVEKLEKILPALNGIVPNDKE